jgi:hypothetical protein
MRRLRRVSVQLTHNSHLSLIITVRRSLQDFARELSVMLAQNTTKRQRLVKRYLQSSSISERLQGFQDAVNHRRANFTVRFFYRHYPG